MSKSVRSAWVRPAFTGFRDAVMLPAWVVGLSLMGVGSLARDVGYPVEAAVLSTILVWAGPSQVLFFASIAAGAAWSAIALAIGFASLRFLPMTVALLPLLRRPGQGIGTQLLIAHYVAVTSWVESFRRLPAMPPEQRVPYFFGFANALIVVSSFTTFVGFQLAGVVPAPVAAGLLCLTPIFFLSSMTAGIRGLGDKIAIGLGLALAPAAGWAIGGGFDLIASGVVGGSIAFLVQRRRKAPKAGE
ncbi:AzlC family ABC transporter permease [Bosea vestrisii]|uniref:AzlC family ABC transporter permease n=1 Tax=Bosea vestrisii TaxID=151416 RepID=UPI0024DF6F48|nr:AzlC family ABC transporter permease [Bosea vestrisii]WID97284.1 AzlC family ABC transporter permease [Bosea vestrisii]